MLKSDRATACFEGGFSCSQAVFTAFSAELGLDQETALKLAGGFGGGMGHTGYTCGAVSGAVMAIGLKHGKCRAEDNEAKAKTYALVQEFCRRFKARHGSLLCTELIGHDLSRPEEAEAAREAGKFKTVCPQLVRDAVEIVEEIS
jgi:C_GCAxxG_C_C family probable redox protein